MYYNINCNDCISPFCKYQKIRKSLHTFQILVISDKQFIKINIVIKIYIPVGINDTNEEQQLFRFS